MPGTGTVTSVAVSSPLGGGPITATGTLTCSTCVVASSPGAGIAHFAGSTQTVTSSAVVSSDLNVTPTSCTNQVVSAISATAVGTCHTVALATDVSGQLPIANVGSAGLSGTSPVTISAAGAIACAGCATTTTLTQLFFQSTQTIGSNLGGTTQNQIKLFSFYLPYPITVSNIAYQVNTADNTANSYDLGLYGPGALGGAANIALALHTGTKAGTALVPSATFHQIAISGAPVTIQPGWYALAITSNAASPAAALAGASGSPFQLVAAWAASSIGGGGATLPSTITAPATSFGVQNAIFVSLF